jgi:hypothetical protein
VACRCKVDRKERPDAGIDIGHKEVQPIESAQAAPGVSLHAGWLSAGNKQVLQHASDLHESIQSGGLPDVFVRSELGRIGLVSRGIG